MGADLGERAQLVRRVVLLREAVTRSYAVGLGNSKSKNRAGSSRSSAVRIDAWPGVIVERWAKRPSGGCPSRGGARCGRAASSSPSSRPYSTARLPKIHAYNMITLPSSTQYSCAYRFPPVQVPGNALTRDDGTATALKCLRTQ